jgi:hypothetical protein
MEPDHEQDTPEEPARERDAQAGRIERLERAVRRLWLALGGASLAAGALALSASPGRGDLAVQKLSIADAEGRVRIALSAADGGSSIEHYDADGRLRISQGIDPQGKAGLSLLDPQGARRIGAAAFADGDAGIAILDRAGKVRIQLLSESDGLSGTLHLDPQGRKRIETLASADGTAVHSFMDPTGVVRLQLGTRPDGAPVFSQPDRGHPEVEVAVEQPVEQAE